VTVVAAVSIALAGDSLSISGCHGLDPKGQPTTIYDLRAK
jgi:hypothetical protein